MKLYHGSSTPITNWEDKPTFFADSAQWAEDWALGSEYDFQIYADDEPTLYTAEVEIKNPYEVKNQDEYEELMDYGTDHTQQIEDLKKQGYDGMIFPAYNTTYYLAFSNKQFKIIGEEALDTSGCEIIEENYKALTEELRKYL